MGKQRLVIFDNRRWFVFWCTESKFIAIIYHETSIPQLNKYMNSWLCQTHFSTHRKILRNHLGALVRPRPKRSSRYLIWHLHSWKALLAELRVCKERTLTVLSRSFSVLRLPRRRDHVFVPVYLANTWTSIRLVTSLFGLRRFGVRYFWSPTGDVEISEDSELCTHSTSFS